MSNKIIFKKYDETYKPLLKNLTVFLNSFHSLSLSEEFWQIIIGTWLRQLILIYYRNDLLDLSKNYEVLYDKIELYPPTDYYEFLKNYDTEKFQFGLNQKIKSIKSKSKYIEKDLDEKKTQIKIKNKFDILLILELLKFYIFKIQLFCSRKKKITILSSYQLSLRDKIILYFKSKFRILIFPNFDGYYRKIHKDNHAINGKSFCQNRSININTFPFKCDKVLLTLAIQLMPVSYLEDFKNRSHFIESIFKYKPRAIFSESQHHVDDIFKMFIARNKIKGSKIIIGQHGARTGLDSRSVEYNQDIDIADKFLSWGWLNKSYKVEPIVSGRISTKIKSNLNLMKEYKPKYFTLVFSGLNKYQGWEYNNDSQNSTQISNSRDILLKLIVKKNIKDFILRKRGDIYFNESNKIPIEYNKFKISNPEDNIIEVYKISRLLIFERLSVGLYECVIFNIPCVLYKSESIDNFDTEHGKQLIKILEDSKMIYSDPKKLIEFLYNSNIPDWWNSEKVQKNRNILISKYTNYSLNFHKDYINKLVN